MLCPISTQILLLLLLSLLLLLLMLKSPEFTAITCREANNNEINSSFSRSKKVVRALENGSQVTK